MPISAYEKDKAEREARLEAELRRQRRAERALAEQAEIEELERMYNLPQQPPETPEQDEQAQQPGGKGAIQRGMDYYDRTQKAKKLYQTYKDLKDAGELEGGTLQNAKKVWNAYKASGKELGKKALQDAGKEVAKQAGKQAAKTAVSTGGRWLAAEGIGAAAAATEATPVGWIITVVILVILVLILIIGVVFGSFLMLCAGEFGGTATKVTVKVSKFLNVGGLGDLCKAMAPLTNQGSQTGGALAGNFANVSSPQLEAFMSCMQNTIPSGVNLAPVSPTTDSHIAAGTCNPLDPNELFNSSTRCQHEQYSCHYGGRSPTCQAAGSFAVDYANPSACRAIQAAAYQCAASLGFSTMPFVNYEGTHVHVSLGRVYDCGCDLAGEKSCP